MEGLILAAWGLVGLLCGSFTNVLIARIPSGENWATGSSRCPRCGHDIAWYDNVPVFSWLWLRRRCRHCRAPISGRYPAVELVVAGLFVLIGMVWGVSFTSAALVFLAVTLTALAAIDFQHMRLPDALVWPSAAVPGIVLVVASVVDGTWDDAVRGLIGAAILAGAYFVLWFAYPRGLGFGDVKLAVALGWVLGYLGWDALAVGAILGPILGAVASVVVIARTRKVAGVRMPYGPWMILAFWIGALAGTPLATGYIEWVSSWT
ncbi:A24 family peptidase [Demequina sp. NBRC 110057]|uniref:prepilin peptidase n=1 Tax=Demequina sp. NBRC 110057 TaxID=1570346 RepID=UPI0009FE2AFD|nr:A24 family peptidase [Demequina sp. NBRC 110057]